MLHVPLTLAKSTNCSENPVQQSRPGSQHRHVRKQSPLGVRQGARTNDRSQLTRTENFATLKIFSGSVGLTEVSQYRLSFRTRGTVSDGLLRERVNTFMPASSIRAGWRSGNARDSV
jgi:hypothetical protein